MCQLIYRMREFCSEKTSLNPYKFPLQFQETQYESLFVQRGHLKEYRITLKYILYCFYQFKDKAVNVN